MAEAMVVFKQNAIEREHMRKELSRIANIDALTGLYTRKFAMEQLQLLMQDSRTARTKLVLMFLDLDNFKEINDKLGHHSGDQTLCNIAEHLRSCVREQDIIARIGGDEFIIIFPGIHEIDDLSPIANDLLESLPPQQLPISLSIGISVFPDDAQSALELLKNADLAMYNVKKGGKNNFCYWQQVASESI
jgi:diguanylate cyclase (GGDEF)-like protein